MINVVLSQKAIDVLVCIKRYIKTNGYAPAQSELAVLTGYSSYAIHTALKELEDAGRIQHTRRKPRTITVRGMRFTEVSGNDSKH